MADERDLACAILGDAILDRRQHLGRHAGGATRIAPSAAYFWNREGRSVRRLRTREAAVDLDGRAYSGEQAGIQGRLRDVAVGKEWFPASELVCVVSPALRPAATRRVHSQLARVRALVGHDDRFEVGVVPDVPCAGGQPTGSNVTAVRLQYCTLSPSPPEAIGMNWGFASQLAPQFHSSVAEAAQ